MMVREPLLGIPSRLGTALTDSFPFIRLLILVLLYSSEPLTVAYPKVHCLFVQHLSHIIVEVLQGFLYVLLIIIYPVHSTVATQNILVQ